MVRAVLLDLDDTLLDRVASVERFLRDQHRRLRLRAVPYEAYRRCFFALDEHGYADRLRVFGALAEEFALPVPAEAMATEYREHAWRRCRLFPDARPVLRALRKRGVRLGVVTNGSALTQEAKLRAAKLSSLVDVALVSEVEGVAKPDAAIFHRAAERLSLAPADCLFVGDNPRTDVAGAVHAGMRAVWLRRHLPWPDDLGWSAPAVVDSLTELLAPGLLDAAPPTVALEPTGALRVRRSQPLSWVAPAAERRR